MERGDGHRLDDARLEGRVDPHSGSFDPGVDLQADGEGREDAEGRGLRRAQLHPVPAAPRRAGRAPALRPAHQCVPVHGREVVRGEPGGRRGATHRGDLEVPVAQDGHDLSHRRHAEDPPRQAARGGDGPQEDARHADALRGHGRRDHGPDADRVEERPSHRHASPRRAGRGAPRGLRGPHHAARGEGVRRRRSGTRWRTSRSRSWRH